MEKVLQLIKTNLVTLLNAGSLVGTTLVTSVLGFAYWLFAARLFTPQAVGLASAMIDAMLLLGTFGVVGLGTLLTGELPRQPQKAGSLISVALIVVGVVGIVLGALFAGTSSFLSKDFRPLSSDGLNILIFALGVGLTTITLVLDQALMGLLRGGLQLWRNTLFAAVKLIVLVAAGFLLARSTGMNIYASWLIGNAVSLVGLIVFIPFRKKGIGVVLPEWGLLRKLSVAALEHHLINIILLAPPLVLPLLVTVMISATANAWFYVSFMLANFVFTLTYALSTVLYAEGAGKPSILARKARLTLGVAFASSIAANIVFQFGAKLILGIFSHVYADQAAVSLRILCLAVFPLIIVSHYITIQRIHNRIIQSILPITVGTIIELLGAAIGAHWGGLSGLSSGWIIGLSIEALFMSPTVYKAIRHVDREPETSESRIVDISTPV
ncbi:MAG TPA: hypothetical protein VFN23_15925 [Ktedonobacteraceae bacterium]|nr:hypothetical protein [Ktedonobacteraceae bacterium]